MFNTPAGSNDDWYWLYAAVWLGRSVKVVTNDEMRDHHFGMLRPRSFQVTRQVWGEGACWDQGAGAGAGEVVGSGEGEGEGEGKREGQGWP